MHRDANVQFGGEGDREIYGKLIIKIIVRRQQPEERVRR